GSLASSRTSKPRNCLRWVPTRRIFAMCGKLTASSNTENKSDKSVCDNASTSNPSKPSSKGFSNSTSLLGRVLRGFLLHRSSVNNSASLSNKFGEFYFIFKFGISGLLHQVVTAIADRIRELLVYMGVHVNDASESSKPSWGNTCTFDTLMLSGQLPGGSSLYYFT
ncbi:hypothetical protein Tco_0091246, partial [Tanacetum coccineum]